MLAVFPAGGAYAQAPAPTIASVAITASPDNAKFYLAGERIEITVGFSAPVQVTGSPMLSINVEGMEKGAAFESIQGSQLVFSYTVTDDALDVNGVGIGANSLTLGVGGSITGAGGTAAYIAHDAVPDDGARSLRVSPSEVTVEEGGSGSYTVALGTEPSGAVRVTITGAAGMSVSLGGDALTFTPSDWNVPQTVTVTGPAQDDLFEADETVTLVHSAAGGGYGGLSASVEVTVTDDDVAVPALVLWGTVVMLHNRVNAVATGDRGDGSIADDDPEPSLTVADASATEGGTVTFTVTLTPVSGRRVTVDWAASDDTATSVDYTSASGTLAFAAGETSKTVTVRTTGDRVDEEDEAFTVTLSNPGNAVIGDASATGTITDDDTRGITIVPPPSAIDEGGSATYTVVLASQPTATVTVTIGGHAGTDISLSGTTLSNNELTFTTSNWGTAQTVTVNAADDDDAIADAAVTLTHTSSGGDYGPVGAVGVTVAVTENDTATLSVADAEASEGDANAAVEFEVTLSVASSNAVTVDYATSDGTAKAGADFTATSGSLTFPAGSTVSQTVRVPVTSDTLDEDNETFTLTLSNPGNARFPGDGTTLAVAGTIADDDHEPGTVSGEGLTIGDASASEGGSLTFTVSLTPVSGRAVTVDWATLDGTAKSADYTAASGSLTFAAGDTTKTVTVSTTDDTLDEDDETLTVTLSNPGNALIGDTNATGTIEDDDEPRSGQGLSVADASADEDAGTLTFTVRLGAASGRTVTVDWATGNGGTAAAGADYTAANGSLSFAPGDTSKSFTVSVLNDALDEDDETFAVALSNAANASIDDAGGTGTILDDDDIPGTVPGEGLTIADASAAEGGSLALTVSLTPVSGRAVTVDWATSDGTAKSADYTAASGSLTFAAGDTTKTVTVSTTEDTLYEEDETFTVTLSNPGNALIGDASATGTIADDDGTPSSLTVSFEKDTHPTAEGAGGAGVTLILSAPADEAITLPVSVSSASTAGVDDFEVSLDGTFGHATFFKVAPGGTFDVTFEAGEDSTSFFVRALDDGAVEGEEWVDFGLGSLPAGVSAGNPAVAKVTFTDGRDVSFGAASYTAIEGGREATVVVRLNAAPGREVVIHLTVADGAGVSGGDYSGVPSSLTFGAAETSKTFTVRAIVDADEESGESVVLSFGSMPAAIRAVEPSSTTVHLRDASALTAPIGPDKITTVTVADNDTAGVTVNPTGVTATEGGATGSYTVVLDTQPTGTVTVTVGDTSADITASPGTLTFTAATWNTAQTVTVTADDDSIAEGEETATLTHAVSGYGTVTTADSVTVTVADNDTAVASTDATLSGLVLNDGTNDLTLTPSFATDTEAYTAEVANSVESVTVTATANDGGATAATLPADADASAAGHQVALGVGDTAITVTVTAADGTTTKTYTATVTRAAAATTDPIWSATMTVGDGTANSARGYYVGEYGGLDDRIFDHETITSGVTSLVTSQSIVIFDLNKDSAGLDGDGLVLEFAGEELPYDEGDGGSSGNQWNQTWLAANAPSLASPTHLTTLPVGGDVIVCLRTAAHADAASIGDGATVEVENLSSGTWGFRAEAAQDAEIGSVRLELSGAKTVARTENSVPWSLYGDTNGEPDGADLPAGSYVLRATAYAEDNLGGDVLQTLEEAFTVEEATETPALSVADADATSGTLSFEVTLAPAADTAVTVDWATADGTATAGADYESASGTLTFAPGETEKTVTVLADGVAETEETLTLTLANSVGAEVDDATATGTIADAGEPEPEPEPESEPAPPLTARFRGVPAEHDGENAFSLRILFSEGIGIGYKTLRDESVSATGGTVTRARRVNGRNDLWEITVRPSGHGDATVTLAGGRACGASGAVCTRGNDRRPLANSPSATVRAQAALSVADAKVQEGPGASVEFRVSLSRAASGTVTVEYATSNATATAGEDYTAASGTLRFGAGETSKTIAVSVLDDAHDEGHETFTLRLSNASGARIADATATGTIENSDPLPQAWLARFGRAASDHVVEAISDRWRDGESQTPRTHFTLGGRQVDNLFGGCDALGAAFNPTAADTGNPALTDESSWARMDRLKTESLAGGSLAGSSLAGSNAGGSNLAGAGFAGTSSVGGSLAGERFAGRSPADSGTSAGQPARSALTNSLGLPTGDLRDVLMGSSFFYSRPLDENGGPSDRPGWLGQWSAWGETAATRFSGADGPLSLDGEVATAMLGVDSRRDRWLAGVALAHSEGEGAYTHPEAAGGGVTSTLTSLNPYVHYRLNEQTSLWGVVGYGVGGLKLTPESAGSDAARRAIETDLATAMAAFGGRGVLSVRSGRTGAFELAIVSDALVTNTVSEATENLMGAAGRTGRLRLMLEGSGSMPLGTGGMLKPTLEAGVRYDAGDAETGAGLEIGGGLGYATGRLEVEVNARALLAHEDTEYEEWGFSGSIRYRPRTDGRGLSMNLGSTWGNARSGVQSLWSVQDASGLARGAAMNAAQRFQVELGYGIAGRKALAGGKTLAGGKADARWVPFLGAETADGGARSLRMGLKLTSGPNLEAGLEFGRRENGREAPERAMELRGTVRF